MTAIPLPAVEFVAFTALAVWLFYWQRKTSRRRPEGSAARDDEPRG